MIDIDGKVSVVPVFQAPHVLTVHTKGKTRHGTCLECVINIKASS